MKPGATDYGNVYRGVHRVLAWGMGISSALYALGVARSWPHSPTIPLTAPYELTLPQVARGLAHLDAASLMWLATVLLILTPVTRVVVAFIAFWQDGDRRFMLVTGAVLAIIALTVFLGRLGLH
jgi:uncharacterized membrane protein